MKQNAASERPKGVLDLEYVRDRQKRPELRFRLSVRAMVVADAVRRYSTRVSGLKILDLGAAEGRTLAEMDRILPANDFFGVEYAEEVVAGAPTLPDNIRLLCGDVASLPADLAHGSFDVVSALAVLEHLPSPQDAVAEAARVLKRGGLFVATAPVPAWDDLSVKLGLLKEDQHETDMTREGLTGLVAAAGLEVLAYEKFMWAPLSVLPYLHLPIPPRVALRCDRLIARLRVFDWLFVNQAVIAQKPW